MDVPAVASGLMSFTWLLLVASGGSISLAGLFPRKLMWVTKYFAIDNISHCSWQMGFLIEQQVYWILVLWTCPSVKIDTDRWRRKGRIEIEPAGIFSRISLCKSSLEVAHAVAKTKCLQIPACANIDCILNKHDLGMMWVCSEGWSHRFPQRMCDVHV